MTGPYVDDADEQQYRFHADSVRRFLVTAPDDNLSLFHIAVFQHLNAIERRAQTIFYTCFSEDADLALQAAAAADVTLQELEVTYAEGEVYPVRRLGSHGLTWVRPVAP